MQMKLILDLAALRVSPLTARRDHDSRQPEHELQVPPRDRRRMVGLDREHQAVAEVALARAGTNEGCDRRSEHRGPCGIGCLRRLVRGVVDDRVEAATVERYAYRSQHLVRALGEGAQDRRRAVVGVSEGRIDEARELRTIGLEAAAGGHWCSASLIALIKCPNLGAPGLRPGEERS